MLLLLPAVNLLALPFTCFFVSVLCVGDTLAPVLLFMKCLLPVEQDIQKELGNGFQLSITETKKSKRIFDYYIKTPFINHSRNNPASILRTINDEVMGFYNYTYHLLVFIREVFTLLLIFIDNH